LQDPIRFQSYYEFFTNLSPETVGGEITTIYSYYNQPSVWDISNMNSALNIFMPLGELMLFGAVGIWQYKWSVR
jgi:hypothetical protein